MKLRKDGLPKPKREAIGISGPFCAGLRKGASELTSSRFLRFLFPESKSAGTYAYVTLRVVVAAFWLRSDIPRWVALAAGRPEANGLVQHLFGASMVVPLTYLFTIFETLSAVSYLLGLLTRLAAVWGVVEFAIIGTPLLLAGNLEAGLVHASLFSASLVLLLNGSPTLSLDGLIAKRLKTN
jgi:uncharacterized membrane protein YphA (DoxX/SURF4 family)